MPRIKKPVLLFLCLVLLFALFGKGVLQPAVAAQRKIAVPEYFYGKRGFLELKSNTVRVPCPPRRVVVLWPYVAELLKALGAEKTVVAVCDNAKEKEWPPYVNKLPTVGKGYQPSVEKILALRPDLVVGYIKPGSATRTQLERAGIPCLNIWGYHPPLLSKEVQTLGLVFDRRTAAWELASYIDKWLNKVQQRTKTLSSKQKPKVYWEWGATPWKSVGLGSTGDLYIKWAGGTNIAPEQGSAWPVVSPEWVAAQNPDVVIKCVSAPESGWKGDAKALEKIRKELMNRPALRNSNAVKKGRVYLIDGMIMYGPREVVGLCYVAKWLHPELFRDVNPKAVHREMLKKFYGEELRGLWVYPSK